MGTSKVSIVPIVFDKAWFKKHQRVLLWFCNAPVIRYWFRWVLRINNDVPWDTNIIQILPNVYAWKHDNVWYKADFRTHPKFSRRLYHAFKPVWVLCHIWDVLIARQVSPALNLGFDTLTVYPDPHAETKTCDGWASEDSGTTTWATLRNNVGDNSNDSEASAQICGTQMTWVFSWWFGYLRRSIYTFDTSALGSTATLSGGVLSIYGLTKSDVALITPDINIYSAAPASNTAVVAGDFDSLGVTACSTTITYAGWSITGYNDFDLNAYGDGLISQIGISKYGARMAKYDAVLTTPTSSSLSTRMDCFLSGYFAENTGTSKDPKLVVTYTPGTVGTGMAEALNSILLI